MRTRTPLASTTPTATGALGERHRGPDRPAGRRHAVPGWGVRPEHARDGLPSAALSVAILAAPHSAARRNDRVGGTFRVPPTPRGAGLPAIAAGAAGMRNRTAFRSCIPGPPPFRPVLEAPRRARVRTHAVRGGQPGRSRARGEPGRGCRLGHLSGGSAERLPLRDRHGTPRGRDGRSQHRRDARRAGPSRWMLPPSCKRITDPGRNGYIARARLKPAA